MQKVGAYLLERRDGMFDAQTRNAEAAALRAEVWKWLRAKGAPVGAASGSYNAEDGSNATFTSESAEDSGQSWSMVRLDEVAQTGRRFVASVSVTTAKEAVIAYASLEAGSAASEINPLDIQAKCPRIVRELLGLPGNWYHGASRLRPLQRLTGFEDGEELALELLSPERTLPWVVVTEIDGGVALYDLESKLIRDLAGLANVARLDEEAAWALTDHLGKPLSCYSGAVRVYWPHLVTEDDPYRHPLWTAQRLRNASIRPDETLTRFRNQLGGVFMRASALSVVRPREIDAIRANAAHRALEALKLNAGSSLADYQALAETYATENDNLRVGNKDLNDRVEALAGRVAMLEETRSVLLARIESAELQLRYREQGDEAITPDTEPQGAEPQLEAPTPGDVRFYKKKYATPKHDIMVHVGDCGCDNWRTAHAADKAKKGIAKLEVGRNDWSKVQHCGSCTGGGMWRVVW